MLCSSEIMSACSLWAHCSYYLDKSAAVFSFHRAAAQEQPQRVVHLSFNESSNTLSRNPFTHITGNTPHLRLLLCCCCCHISELSHEESQSITCVLLGCSSISTSSSTWSSRKNKLRLCLFLHVSPPLLCSPLHAYLPVLLCLSSPSS